MLSEHIGTNIADPLELYFSNGGETYTISSYGLKLNETTGYYEKKVITPAKNVYFGYLLIDFINSNFSSMQEFNSFISRWGYSGLLDIPDIPEIKSRLSSQEFLDFQEQLWKSCRDLLNNARHDFIEEINYCFISSFTFLESLSPTKRYFLLTQTQCGIQDIYLRLKKYSDPLSFEYRAIMSNYNNKEYPKLSHEELANVVKNEDIGLMKLYTISNFLNFCYYELNEMIFHNKSIKKCNNCGKYFIPQVRNNKLYCDCCKDIGYENKIKNDDYMRAYRNEYKARHAKTRKITNTSKVLEAKLQLSNWSSIALEKAKLKDLPFKEFILWLKK